MALPPSAVPAPRSASPAPDGVPTIDLAANATQNYTTDEFVRLNVGGHDFTVAKSRLTMRSLEFQELFELPQAQVAGGDAHTCDAIVLHNDLDEFKDFIWFIHADHISLLDFQASSPSKEKCSRLLGIASIAHFYEADAIANWAMNGALQLLTSNAQPQPQNDVHWASGFHVLDPQPQVAAFQLDADLVMRLLRTASRWSDTSDVARCARDIILDAMNPERYGPPVDPVEALQAALELNDASLAAHAYFYISQKGMQMWKTDTRLRPIDRRNIVCGALALWERQLPVGQQSVHFTRYSSPVHVAGFIPDWRQWSPSIHPRIQHIRRELPVLFSCSGANLID